MNNDCNKQCTNSELVVNLKSVRRPKFKPGADLSGKVNKVDIEMIEASTDDSSITELKLKFNLEACYTDIEM